MLSKLLINKKTFLITVFVFILFLIGLQLIKIHQTQAVFCLPGEVEVTEDCDGNEIVPAKCCPSDKPEVHDGVCVAECPVSCLPDQVLVEVDCDGNTLSPAQCCSQDYPEWDDGCVEACPPDYMYMYGDDNAVVPICAGTPPHYTDQCDRDDDEISTYCTNQDLDWTYNGYVKVYAPEETYGHAQCCGDDSYEFFTSCAENSDIKWNCDGSVACCPYDNQFCVKNGECYTYNRAYGGLNSGGNDNYAYCTEGPSSEIEWQDCDGNYSVGGCNCGSKTGVFAGHDDPYPGEYINLTSKECCGDDADEYYASNGYCYSSETLSPDGPSPTVESLSASPTPICNGESTTINWTVSGNGGADLKRVEVWQCELTRDAECGNGGRDWEKIDSCDTSVSGDSANGSCSVNPTINTKYGIHVINIFDNQGTEDSPVEVTVNDTPDAPTNLTFSDITQTSATLNWEDNSENETGFYIHRDGSKVHTTDADVTTWTDSSLSANTSYTYTITAYNDCGSSGTASGSVTTLEAVECEDGDDCDEDACSTQDCDNQAGDGFDYTYLQTRDADEVCDDGSCICPAWSAYQSCEDSYNNCNVDCYTGSNCYTDSNKCYCKSGYEPNGSGGCQAVPSCEDDDDCDDDVCSTQQCDALGDYTYLQTRDADEICDDGSCICPAWSAYQSCENSYNNCDVECYTGANCLTSTNQCYCDTGYESDGAGGCQVESGDENTPPDEPTNLAQFDDNQQLDEQDKTNDTTPYFTFTISDPDDWDIVGYQIQIDSDAAFNPPVIDYTWDGSTTNPNDVTYQVPEGSELENANYRWRVRAKDQHDAYSDWVYFSSDDDGGDGGGDGDEGGDGGGDGDDDDDSPIDFTIDTDYTHPVADFSFCKQEGTQIVQFTNESTDEDGDDLTYSWDFDSRDGIQEDSTAENPTHDYEGVVLGKTHTQQPNSSIPQPHEIVEQASQNFFEKFWEKIKKFYLTNSRNLIIIN